MYLFFFFFSAYENERKSARRFPSMEPFFSWPHGDESLVVYGLQDLLPSDQTQNRLAFRRNNNHFDPPHTSSVLQRRPYSLE